MDILPNIESRNCGAWYSHPQTSAHDIYIITKLASGGCKYDNIPISKDGRIAFIDTQNNLCFDEPLPYFRLFNVLKGDLRTLWEELIKKESEK